MIGSLFQRARASHIDTVRYLLECGQKLIEQKEATPFGEWLLWVKRHQQILGFNDRTARRLMDAARRYRSSTTDLDDDSAAKLNRLIWGNEPEISPYEPRPLIGYASRVSEWTARHAPEEADDLTDEERVQLLDSFARWESFMAAVRARIQRPLLRRVG